MKRSFWILTAGIVFLCIIPAVPAAAIVFFDEDFSAGPDGYAPGTQFQTSPQWPPEIIIAGDESGAEALAVMGALKSQGASKDAIARIAPASEFGLAGGQGVYISADFSVVTPQGPEYSVMLIPLADGGRFGAALSRFGGEIDLRDTVLTVTAAQVEGQNDVLGVQALVQDSGGGTGILLTPNSVLGKSLAPFVFDCNNAINTFDQEEFDLSRVVQILIIIGGSFTETHPAGVNGIYIGEILLETSGEGLRILALPVSAAPGGTVDFYYDIGALRLPGLPPFADAYLGLTFPDGSLRVMGPDFVPGTAVVPVASSLGIGSRITGSRGLTVPGTAPLGEYTFKAVLVPRGMDPRVQSNWIEPAPAVASVTVAE